MTKSIETLVEDIYGLFSDRRSVDTGLLDGFLADLGGVVAARFDPEAERGKYLRISNIGRPDRQLWYEINSTEPSEEFSPSTLIKFSYGDILEHYLIFLARLAGHTVEHQQREVEIEGVKGHLDCIIDGVVVDIKSASTYSYMKFYTGALLEEGNDPFGYVAQLAGYVEATTPDSDGAFLAIDKTLGKITLLKVPNDVLKQYQVRARIRHAKAMVVSPEVPVRCHSAKPDGKSGNFILDTGCSYCAHKYNCWEDSNSGAGLRTFFYSSGPRFFTHVEREPNVPESNKF